MSHPKKCHNKLTPYWKKKIKNNEKIDLYHLTKYYVLSEELLYKYLHEFEEIDWEMITRYQMLSEEFIRSNYQIFDSFQFARICWINVSYFQQLSEEFICEFYEKLELYMIGNRQLINEDKLRSLEVLKKITE